MMDRINPCQSAQKQQSDSDSRESTATVLFLAPRYFFFFCLQMEFRDPVPSESGRMDGWMDGK